ncbi:CopG family transcriptional regulator [Phycicoccus sp. CSK15P-2]|uniref:CopG family transcriptional regulator n=1 Tax=Phycicoccus sp. CSK15P-2 TaxID=2807627 RepID=UPI001950511A|nr:CopG family transcriptional regulator [Phycicoccus sp. CSK15P-2]MBM6403561.1 CopG family transcriptional regulator [Phycicoccus sp. CSK15P-2]
MRTTVNLTPDIEAEVARMRREEGMGTSEAVVTLARRGLRPRPEGPAFRQRSASLGARIDVGNVAEVLDLLDDA